MNTKPFAVAVAAALTALAVGCATTGGADTTSSGGPPSVDAAADQFAASQPSELQPFFKALYVEGEHNAALNFDYLGLAALETAHYRIAAKAFDADITRIEAVYADNPSAQKAKSLFAEEKVKDFKGEPYERAMTYFYRGLLYARTGDFENARASFLSAEAQSMMSESESYENTFGLMDFLAGWASHCDGDDSRADDLGARAAKVQPDPFSSLDDKVNYIALADVGLGPIKYGTGKYEEKLSFKPTTDGPIQIASIGASGATVGSAVLGADINYQAMTRGGRPVDAILNGKAEWKGATQTASGVLTGAGYAAALEGAATGNNSLEEGGTISMAAGLVSGLFSRAMTAKADTRAWASLPAGIEIATGTLQGASAPQISVTADENGDTPATPLNVKAGQCALSWTKTPSLLQLAASRVGSPEPQEDRHEAENQALRAFLESSFPSAQSAQTAQASTPQGQQ